MPIVSSRAIEGSAHSEYSQVVSASFFAATSLLVCGFSSGIFALYEMPAFSNIHSLSISQQKVLHPAPSSRTRHSTRRCCVAWLGAARVAIRRRPCDRRLRDMDICGTMVRCAGLPTTDCGPAGRHGGDQLERRLVGVRER